jgi:hypothetical protein
VRSGKAVQSSNISYLAERSTQRRVRLLSLADCGIEAAFAVLHAVPNLARPALRAITPMICLRIGKLCIASRYWDEIWDLPLASNVFRCNGWGSAHD